MRLGLNIRLFLLTAACLASGARAEDELRFGRDVLPILSDNCFKCHGPDEKQRQAELRLDVEESAKATRESGLAISPGKPGESLLVERIRSTDPDLRMPPPDSNKKLTPRQIETLTKWIEQGAKWGKHWSLEPLVRPEVPVLGATGSLPARASGGEAVCHLATYSLADKPPVAPGTRHPAPGADEGHLHCRSCWG